MKKHVEQFMQRKLRHYRREGKSADWIRSWKRKFYETGREMKR